jgi:hypothetical protein
MKCERKRKSTGHGIFMKTVTNGGKRTCFKTKERPTVRSTVQKTQLIFLNINQ